MERIPASTKPHRGLLQRLPLVDRVLPGVASTRAAVAPFAAAWDASNRHDATVDGPLWLVMGDSTAQGIGTAAFDSGYAGQLRRLLEARDRVPWRLLNVSRSGDRVLDVLANQLPVLRRQPSPPDLITCLIGANDLLKTSLPRLLARFGMLIGELPEGAVIGTVPQGLGRGRAVELNRLICEEAPRRGLRVADIWAVTGPPWSGRYAADGFHPNETGYRSYTAVIAEAIGLPVPPGYAREVADADEEATAARPG